MGQAVRLLSQAQASTCRAVYPRKVQQWLLSLLWDPSIFKLLKHGHENAKCTPLTKLLATDESLWHGDTEASEAHASRIPRVPSRWHTEGLLYKGRLVRQPGSYFIF